MTTSSDPHAGEIWLAYVYFSDHPEVGKVRPVLVLSAESPDTVVAAKITSSAKWEKSDYLAISDWAECGLVRPSFIQLFPLVKIERSQLLRRDPLGRVSQELLHFVIAMVNA